MKKTRVMLIALSALFIFSCGGNKQNEQQQQSAPAPGASDLMKEAPAYDATKIDPNAPVVEITIRARGNTMDDMSYDQSELTMKQGTTIKLTLINESKDASMQHNFMIITEGTADKVGPEGVKAGADNNYIPKMKDVFVATKVTKPGEKTSITFPAPAAANYDYICSFPGHYQRMHGKLKVGAAS